MPANRGRAVSLRRRGRRVDKTRHRLQATIGGGNREIGAAEIERGLVGAAGGPTEANVSVVRLDLAHEADSVPWELALRLFDHGIDGGVSVTAPMGVDIT